MVTIASDHIKPCNIGQSEAHNLRTKEYLAHINKSNIYVRTDLMPQNESWRSPMLGDRSLQDYHDLLARLVKEKTGRALQTKERTRVDKKTGKVIKVSGSSPIRESVVVCKEDTTMVELKDYCERCHATWGITALQIHIHRDEGHYSNPEDRTSWKSNYHAHIVWDWMNHDTGKSCKLSKEDMSRMQSMVAGALGMERGKAKSETGSVHLDRNDFIIAKQMQEAERLAQENHEKEQRSVALDAEIADKQSKANAENGNAILSGVAHLMGKGKYVELEKENEQLKADMQRQTAEWQVRVDAKETELQAVQRSYRQQVKITTQKNAEKLKSLQAKVEWRQKALDLLSAYLMRTHELFKRAVQAVIDFAKEKYQSHFHQEQAAIVNEAIHCFANSTKGKQAIGNMLIGTAIDVGRLNTAQEYKAAKEVDAVVAGEYEQGVERKEGLGL